MLGGDNSVRENTTVIHVQVSSPNNFDFLKPEFWPLWKKRFERYLTLANLLTKTEAEKIDILCYAMGEQSEAILLQLMPNTNGKSLADVLQAFTEHFCPKKSVILERYLFNSRIQHPDEDVDQFVSALHMMAESCEYGNMKHELIRDRIVVGLSDPETFEKLRLESNLTLENAVTIARQIEIQRSQQAILQASSSTTDVNPETESTIAKRETNQTSVSRETAISKHENQEIPIFTTGEMEDSEMMYVSKSVSNTLSQGQLMVRENCENNGPTEVLYTIVGMLLNNLTPQNYYETIGYFKALKIDTQEKFVGFVDLIFEKAVNEPDFSAVYALMCKDLAMMEVSGPDSEVAKQKNYINLRKLIINRCQIEFEKNTVHKNARAIKLKEIEDGPDPEMKNHLQLAFTEEERKIQIKSVGNIRYIGELFKRGMLTTNIMHRCIRHLLTQTDEESLECLCKLLSTIGKDLESKNQNLDPYFDQMIEIVSCKVSGKVSSISRLRLVEVIELRRNKWVLRRDGNNSKTVNEFQKKPATECWNTYLNNTPSNTSRKFRQKRSRY